MYGNLTPIEVKVDNFLQRECALSTPGLTHNNDNIIITMHNIENMFQCFIKMMT